MNWWDFGWWTAARDAAAAEALGALVGAGAIITALYVAFRDGHRRRDEKEDEQRAQARLVDVMGPMPIKNADGRFSVEFQVQNESDRPILWLTHEVWIRGQKLSEEPYGSLGIARLGPNTAPRGEAVGVPHDPEEIVGWRVRWRDSTGREWCFDQHHRDDPVRVRPRRRGLRRWR